MKTKRSILGSGGMPYLKGCLHVHTNQSDGANSLEEMLSAYQDLGYGFIAITDHDFMVPPGYWERLPENHDDLIIFKGLEIEYPPIQFHHITRIVGQREILYIYNHPSQYELSISEVKKEIEIASREMPIHCLEVSERGVYIRYYDTPRIHLPKIVTDDAHGVEECGRAWIEVFAKTREPDSILQAIKQGSFQIRYRLER